MTFEIDFTKLEIFTKVRIKTSPNSESFEKAIKGHDDFILLQDRHYKYTENALGWIKYADGEPPILIGMLRFYETDTFFVNGKEVWMHIHLYHIVIFNDAFFKIELYF